MEPSDQLKSLRVDLLKLVYRVGQTPQEAVSNAKFFEQYVLSQVIMEKSEKSIEGAVLGKTPVSRSAK